jgi:hypothetical protein
MYRIRKGRIGKGWIGLVRVGLVRVGLVRVGLVRVGLVRVGLVRVGLVRVGLIDHRGRIDEQNPTPVDESNPPTPNRCYNLTCLLILIRCMSIHCMSIFKSDGYTYVLHRSTARLSLRRT